MTDARNERDYPQNSPFANDYDGSPYAPAESPLARDYPKGHPKNAESAANIAESKARAADIIAFGHAANEPSMRATHTPEKHKGASATLEADASLSDPAAPADTKE